MARGSSSAKVAREESEGAPGAYDEPRCPGRSSRCNASTASTGSSSRMPRLPPYAGPEGAVEDIVGHTATLRDPLGLVEGPVDAQVDPTLAVLLLGGRER